MTASRASRRAWARVVLCALTTLAACAQQRLVMERVSSPSIDLVVRYPDHITRGTMDSLWIDVRNVSARGLDDAVLLLDSTYAPTRGETLDVRPARGAYAIRLATIAPEESRTISALIPEGRAEGFWSGRIAVAVGRDTVSIRIHPVIDRE